MTATSKVVMFRTIGGEFIIGMEDNTSVVGPDGKVQEDNQDTYKITDARIFNLQMTRAGAAVAFVPIFPFSTAKNLDNIEIKKSAVLLKVTEDQLDGEIINGYKGHITGIDLSAQNKFVM